MYGKAESQKGTEYLFYVKCDTVIGDIDDDFVDLTTALHASRIHS